MPKIAQFALLLTTLRGTSVAQNVQAAVSPAHPVSQTATDERSSSPWGYEQQRQKAMRQVNHVLPLEQEPQGKAIGK